MSQEDQAAQDAKHRRKRKIETGGRVFCVFAAAVLLPIFVTAVWAGYLSRIGIVVGLVYLLPGILSPIAGLAGKKRLEGFLFWLSVGTPILWTLAVSLAAVWPVDDGNQWTPYQFDRELAAFEVQRAVPAEENAALRCVPLFARLDVNDKPEFFFRDNSLRDEFRKSPWTSAEYPEIAQWFDTYSGVVDELVHICATGTFHWPLQANPFDEFTVPHQPLGRSVQLLIASANRDLGEHRLDEAITKYFCVTKIAHDLRQQMQTMDWRSALGIERDALRMIRRMLVRHDLSEAAVARIEQGLPSTEDLWINDRQVLLQLEKLRYMNALARLYERNSQGRVRFCTTMTLSSKSSKQIADRKTWRWFRLYWVLNMPLDPHGLRDVADDYFARFGDPFEPAMGYHSDLDDGMAWCDFCKTMANFYRWFTELTFSTAEDYPRTRLLCALQAVERRGTWLVLGLHQYREAHGQWPESLDAIAAYVPAEALRDPMNEGPFVYVRQGDDFRLYSKGPDGIDANAAAGSPLSTTTEDDDIIIWPIVMRQSPESRSDEAMKEEPKKVHGERTALEMLEQDSEQQ